MNNIARNHFDIGYMDSLAQGNSALHRLDPRAKIITTLLFIVAVVSFGKYTVLAFIPFFIFPVFLITAGGLPAGYFVKKVLLISPLAVLLGMFNPLIDRDILVHIGTIGLSGGWISLISIVLRFLLTVSAALILVALTGFNPVCRALTKLGVPKAFVVQLLFFYRYLFVLTDETHRMDRARSMRSFHSGLMSFRTFISLIGHLLLRTLDRAERIYHAMCCRGFNGVMPVMTSGKRGMNEFVFVAAWLSLFLFFRIHNIPLILGTWMTESYG